MDCSVNNFNKTNNFNRDVSQKRNRHQQYSRSINHMASDVDSLSGLDKNDLWDEIQKYGGNIIDMNKQGGRHRSVWEQAGYTQRELKRDHLGRF